jgi:transcriptional regulator with XRE-family HTH domain
MARRKRPAIQIEAAQLATDAVVRMAREIRETRETRGWTQATLARKAGLTRPVFGRIERAEVDPGIRQLEQIALALGRPMTLSLSRDPAALPADAGHLEVQELVLAAGRRLGYEARFELATRPSNPWRSVDVLLSSRARRTVIVVECWNVMGDLGAATRSSSRKRVEAADLALAAWGPAVSAHLVWVVRNVPRNRLLVATYPEVFAARFPGSSRAWIEALVGGGRPPSEDGLVWVDTRTKRFFAWRRRPR